MSKTYKFWFNKLVRDKSIEIMNSEGILSDARIMDEHEYFVALKNKLLEEAQEVADSSDEDLLGELADVLEVIHCIAEANRRSLKDIENLRLKKIEQRGSFKSRIFVSSVSTQKRSGRLIDYLKSKPNEYLMEEIN